MFDEDEVRDTEGIMECVKCYAEISIHDADDGMCQECIDKINGDKPSSKTKIKNDKNKKVKK